MKRTKKRKLLFILIGGSMLLVFLELLLQGLSILSPRVEMVVFPYRISEMYKPDEKLGHRPTPNFLGHDSKGFRNSDIPASADIVALGDSQTYGVAAEMQEAWPQQVEKLTGRRCYNMAFGGWCAIQSYNLIGEAMAFKPKLIVECLYSGNDLYDCYRFAYEKPIGAQFSVNDTEMLSVFKNLNDRETVDQMSYRTAGYPPSAIPKNSNKNSAQSDEKGRTTASAPRSLRVMLAENCALYGLARAIAKNFSGKSALTKSESWEEIKREYSDRPLYFKPFECEQAKSLLMPAYRLGALNLDDPRIREGLEVQLRVLAAMKMRLKSEGVEFLVVCMPTTEYVFAEQVEKKGADLGDEYRKLIMYEAEMWRLTTSRLKDQNIQYIELLPTLRQQLQKGPQPYPMKPDGHPNSYGYKAVAEAIAATLQTRSASGRSGQ